MSKVLIIGAGGVANVVAKKCAQNSTDYSELLIATRTKSRADKIASSITNIPVHTAQVDADHASEVAAIIRDFKPCFCFQTFQCVPVDVSHTSMPQQRLIFDWSVCQVDLLLRI